MREVLPWVVLLACGAPAEPKTTASQTPAATVATPAPDADDEALARAVAARGVLDVAAEHARRAFAKKGTAEAKRAYGLALADAWAFEKAREVLGDDPSLPKGDLGPIEPEGDRIERALRALAARDAKTARDELTPAIGPRAAPLVLELMGRAKWMLGEEVEARRAWARARSRIDASGAHLGMLATAAGAVETMGLRDGRLVVARMRERYLVGGYQSSHTNTVWIESYAIGDPDPLTRFPTGNIAGVALSADGKTIGVADRPLDQIIAPVPETMRLLDLRTGRENAAWDATNATMLRPLGASSWLASQEHAVVVWDQAGRVSRTLTISGKTPGVMRVYRAGRGTMHDTIPMTYDSEPIAVESAPDGTIAVGATDGVVWIWRPGAASGFQLKPSSTPSMDQDARRLRPLAMRFDATSTSLLVASGDGAVTRWDLAQRRPQRLVEPRCTDAEFENASFGSQPTPEALTRCAEARNAGFSPDGARVVFTSFLGGPRVRDTKTGAPISTLDTLAADAMAFVDRDGVWLGGVDGTIDRWDMTSGKRAEPLRQGGINGFLQGLSRDGRYVSVGDAMVGFRTQSAPKVQIWDTTLRRPMPGLPSDVAQAIFGDRDVALVATREHGAFLWDLSTAKRIADLPKNEAGWTWSDDHQRIVSFRTGTKLVVRSARDARTVLREIDVGSQPWGFALDRDAHTAATLDEHDQLSVWNLEDGRTLLAMHAVRGSVVALSPSGRAVLWRSDPKEIVVTSVDDKRELARMTSKELAPDHDYEPIRAGAFVSETEALLVGPGAPGYERIYKWTLGEKAVPTELQVLGGEQMEIWPNGVAAIHDRNDTVYLLRIADGKLITSVHATRGAGWLAMTREGAVDASPEGRSAAITIADAKVTMGRSSWLGWDRFEVPALLVRAARGEIVAPPIAGYVERSDTMTGRRD